MGRDHLNTISDDMLLKRIGLHDDHDAFSVLYDRYWNRSLSIAYNLTKDKSIAQDIVQDFFITFWNRRKIPEIINFESYLAVALKFSIFSHFEKERRRRIIREEKIEIKQEAVSDQQIETIFLHEYLLSLLENLPEKCKLVLTYSRIEGMTNAEIAKTMNISEKTVEGHLTKGLKIIRNKFNYQNFIILMIISGL